MHGSHDAWLPLSDSSRAATGGETTAPSRMEQFHDVGGALLRLVQLSSDAGIGERCCSPIGIPAVWADWRASDSHG